MYEITLFLLDSDLKKNQDCFKARSFALCKNVTQVRDHCLLWSRYLTEAAPFMVVIYRHSSFAR